MLHEKLECYRRSVRLAEELSKEGARWPRGYGYLVDQLRRAMASVVLNLAEGNTRRGVAERRRFFDCSRGSASEVAAALDLTAAFGLMAQDRVDGLKSRLSAVCRMIWALP